MGRDKILKDKVSIITGAGRGIGKHISLLFAKEGSNLVLVSRTLSEIEELAKDCRNLGVEAIAVKTDMSSCDEIENCVKTALKHFSRINILVNNAGYSLETPIIDYNIEDWEKIFEVNFFGPLTLTSLILKIMIKNKEGNIINIASRAAGHGFPFYGAYSAAKAALLRLTESCSYECRRYGIRINAVSPARVVVERVKKNYPEEAWRFWIKPEEVANVVLFLASDMSKALNGIEIRVFGNLYHLATYDFDNAENVIKGEKPSGPEVITW